MRSINFPPWLYLPPRVRAVGVSSTAIFDPARAIDGEAWSSSISPGSANTQKKTILITRETLAAIPSDFAIFCLRRLLVDNGFRVELYGVKGYPVCIDDVSDLMSFDSRTDYVELMDYKIPRDHWVVLDEALTKELNMHLCAQSDGIFQPQISELKQTHYRAFAAMCLYFPNILVVHFSNLTPNVNLRGSYNNANNMIAIIFAIDESINDEQSMEILEELVNIFFENDAPIIDLHQNLELIGVPAEWKMRFKDEIRAVNANRAHRTAYQDIEIICDDDPYCCDSYESAVSRRKPASRSLYIAPQPSNILDSQSGATHQTFHMTEAGVVLSGNPDKLSIRMRAENYGIQTNAAGKREIIRNQSPFTHLECLLHAKLLSRNALDTFIQDQDFSIVQFSQTLTVECTRMQSIHPQEAIFFIENSPDDSTEIILGRDNNGFMHARLPDGMAPVVFSYVACIRNTLLTTAAYDAIPVDYPPKKWVELYKNDPRYREIADPDQSIPDLNHEDYNEDDTKWFFDVFVQRAGVCWHRACAAAATINKFTPGFARNININNNHVVIEIFYNGQWIPVDLGGGANYTEEYAPAATPAPSEESRSISITNFQDFLTRTGHTKIVVCHPSVDLWVNAFFRDQNGGVFYADALHQLTDKKSRVVIDSQGRPVMTDISAFALFVQSPDARVLVIDIQQFTAAQHIALGSISIPDHISVIYIHHKMLDDYPFPVQASVDMSSVIFDSDKREEEPQIISIDLNGFSDWKKALLGSIILNNNTMHWDNHTAFLHALQSSQNSSAYTMIEIGHFPECDRVKMQQFLNHAKAKGYFDYYDHRILIPDNLFFSCSENQYDFRACIVDSVTHNATASALSNNVYLINKHTFDILLIDKQIDHTVYYNEAGILEKSQGAPIQLFITTALSDAQWWCLCKTAEKYHVRLQLLLAPGVLIPDDVQKNHDATLPEIELCETLHRITNNADVISPDDNGTLAINSEDYSYQDLIYGIHYERKDNGFHNFEIQISDFFLQLLQGKTVILKGQFSDELLASLHTLLLPENSYVLINGRKQFFSGKLLLRIEDKSLTTTDVSEYQSTLRWLGNLEADIVPSADPNTSVFKTELPATDFSLELEDATAFIEQRKDDLFDAFEFNSPNNSAMVQLTGKSGVGKSRLMLALHNDPARHCTVHREMDQFEAWASDRSDKIKILFIDESNIDDMHYTMFSPLKPGGSKQVLYKGKLYQLDDTHKVVFACNALNYGGGRVAQKLFEDRTIPEIQYADFPPCYIYHEILKPIFDAAELNVSEANFKIDAQRYIEMYLSKQNMTVRELQQLVLSYCLRQKNKQYRRSNFSGMRLFQVAPESDFAKVTRSQVNAFIHIKKLQQCEKLPAGIGLNGILIEGDVDDAGKRSLAETALQQNRCDYITLLPTLSLAEKKAVLIDAWEKGCAVLIMDINCYCDDGLEKILNKLLTGEHPDTGKSPANPGFFLVGTVKGLDKAGARSLSPAVQHRCVNVRLNKLTLDVLDIHQPRNSFSVAGS